MMLLVIVSEILDVWVATLSMKRKGNRKRQAESW